VLAVTAVTVTLNLLSYIYGANSFRDDSCLLVPLLSEELINIRGSPASERLVLEHRRGTRRTTGHRFPGESEMNCGLAEN
jgi:hypothetical protein